MEYNKLIEPTTYSFLQNTLKRCHEQKVKIYCILLNMSVLILFLLITGSILYYCYKRKMTPQEKYEKMLKDQQYILSKIRYYQEERKKNSFTNITNLPCTM